MANTRRNTSVQTASTSLLKLEFSIDFPERDVIDSIEGAKRANSLMRVRLAPVAGVVKAEFTKGNGRTLFVYVDNDGDYDRVTKIQRMVGIRLEELCVIHQHQPQFQAAWDGIKGIGDRLFVDLSLENLDIKLGLGAINSIIETINKRRDVGVERAGIDQVNSPRTLTVVFSTKASGDTMLVSRMLMVHDCLTRQMLRSWKNGDREISRYNGSGDLP